MGKVKESQLGAVTESFLGGYLQMIKGEILDDLGGPFVGFVSLSTF